MTRPQPTLNDGYDTVFNGDDSVQKNRRYSIHSRIERCTIGGLCTCCAVPGWDTSASAVQYHIKLSVPMQYQVELTVSSTSTVPSTSTVSSSSIKISQQVTSTQCSTKFNSQYQIPVQYQVNVPSASKLTSWGSSTKYQYSTIAKYQVELPARLQLLQHQVEYYW